MRVRVSQTIRIELNGICPYFTMFPLEFPLKILKKHGKTGQSVLDPFCGRGTTNFAARLAGLDSMGVDSSPVAVAISASKLVVTTAEEIVAEARNILERRNASPTPKGEFWQWAYHPTVLDALCRFRTEFLYDCTSAPRTALRAIILGALHGPRRKIFQSYFSNQCPRTYAPKPAYSVRFWKERCLEPQLVDILDVIERRARRYFEDLPKVRAQARLADSRFPESFAAVGVGPKFDWVITSPPYYGMRTYIPDQWLRNWFLGGASHVDYTNRDQVVHSSPTDFTNDLRKVWQNAADVCSDSAKMVIRFGGIADRKADPLTLIKTSMYSSGWRMTTLKKAGSANEGKRQANTFLRNKTNAITEYDVWATRL